MCGGCGSTAHQACLRSKISSVEREAQSTTILLDLRDYSTVYEPTHDERRRLESAKFWRSDAVGKLGGQDGDVLLRGIFGQEIAQTLLGGVVEVVKD